MHATATHSLVDDLETNGIACLPQLVEPSTLRDMQAAFASRLQRLRWNDHDGYERSERYRLMVHDLLTLAQGFVDVALHPLVTATLNDYLGASYELVEAKGWMSLPTRRDFHGWHGDAWYDQDQVKDRIPREVKLAFYLTDVKSGAFQYIRGSHGRNAPRTYFGKTEVQNLPMDQIVEMRMPAGSAFLFDTTGIHRQAYPILEPRRAFFLNYHDPSVPLQREDVDYYRYHPLLLNAAFLGELSAEKCRILGFGNKSNFVPAYTRRPSHAAFQAAMEKCYGANLFLTEFRRRVSGKLRRLVGMR